MFQYPNQNDVLLRNTEAEEMANNISKKIRFTIYNKWFFPIGERQGKIISVSYPDYVVSSGTKNYLVSKDDYISIF